MYALSQRILLVEPDDDDARIIGLALTGEAGGRREVERVRDLEAALHRLREADFEVVLLSECAAADLRAVHRLVEMAPRLAVVVLAEDEDPRRHGEWVQAGVQEVLAKGHANGPTLARALQYAHERKRTEEVLRTNQMILEARIEDRTRHLRRLNERLREEIRQREEAERELRRESAFIATVLDTVSALVMVVDRAGRIQEVNRALLCLSGYERDFLRGRPCWDPLARPEDRPAIEALLKAVVEQGESLPQGVEMPLVTRDGQVRLIRWDSAVLRDEAGRVEYMVACGSDVTEQHRAKERERRRLLELAQASRLSTMGEMAAEIAHELNQPLSAIANYARAGAMLLGRGEADPQGLARAFEEIATQAQRGGEVIRRLRQFVGKAELARVPCEINALVEEMRRLIEIEARWNQVRLEIELAPDLPLVLADRILVEQVILNLARNAIEAMQEVAPQRRRLLLRTGRGHDDMIFVEVRDSGPGMSPERMAQIFDRFFTTKEQGMGIGLSICRSIAESHGGRLTAESRPGEGACFRFLLPVWRGDG